MKITIAIKSNEFNSLSYNAIGLAAYSDIPYCNNTAQDRGTSVKTSFYKKTIEPNEESW